MEINIPRSFDVNDYITLKYEDEKTNIYVKGRYFIQCKYLLLQIPVDESVDYEEIDSIDDAAEKLDHSEEPVSKHIKSKLPSDVEFWGHCSNLQVWAEHSYDTRLLHRNMAFPLLKKLTDVGDPNAKKVFKEEIALRFLSGHQTVVKYLLAQKYLKYLTTDEMETIIGNVQNHTNLVQLCYNLLKSENDLFSITLKDRFTELSAPVLKKLIIFILGLVLKEKKHIWGMEKLGGDFHSIQMKILIKLKNPFMSIMKNKTVGDKWAESLRNFLKKIYQLTFNIIGEMNRNIDSRNPERLEALFEHAYSQVGLKRTLKNTEH